MTHKLKTEMFSQKIEYSGGVFFWPPTPLFSFVSFHLNPVTDRTACPRSLFQAYKSAMHFRTSRFDVNDYASV